MSTFKVKEAAVKKEIPDGKFGPMKVIGLHLQDQDAAEPSKNAEWFTKAATPVPEVGDLLEGDLEESAYGLKFKRTPPAGGWGAGAGASTWKPRDPAESRAITRQHSQHMAILWFQFCASVDAFTDGAPLNLNHLREAIDWFDADVESVRGRTPPAASSNGPTLASPEQKKKVRSECTKAGLKKTVEIEMVLRELGIGVAVEDGWLDRLTSAQASALIGRLGRGVLPDSENPSDIPTDFPREPTPQELAEAQAAFEAEAGK